MFGLYLARRPELTHCWTACLPSEHHLKKLSSAASAHVVSSGMAALDLILRLVKPGDTVLAGDDLYGGTNRLLGWLGTDGGVVSPCCHASSSSFAWPSLTLSSSPPSRRFTTAIRPTPRRFCRISARATRSRWCSSSRRQTPCSRSPTSARSLPSFAPERPCVAFSAAASSPYRRHRNQLIFRSYSLQDALIVADNTMMSPYLQRPLDLGCDISYDSGTKFLSGHHDLMAGAVTARTPEVGARLSWFTNAMGTALAPFDCFLLLRGLKTLPLRMDKQQASCEVLARYLDALGFAVHYPGLTSDPGHAVHFSQSTGAGAVMSFETGDVALSEGIVGGTRLFGISVSFGAVNSLISMPCLMRYILFSSTPKKKRNTKKKPSLTLPPLSSHASIPAHLRAERGLPEHLIRLCVGIEDVNDLLDDLETSLISSGAIRHRFQDKSQHSSGLETPTSERSLQDGGWEVERARGFERVPLGGGAGAAPIGGAAASSSGAGGPPTPEDVERALEAAAKEEAPLVDGESLDHAREDILVSAPGKVILFGEHAVVHGVVSSGDAETSRAH